MSQKGEGIAQIGGTSWKVIAKVLIFNASELVVLDSESKGLIVAALLAVESVHMTVSSKQAALQQVMLS